MLIKIPMINGRITRKQCNKSSIKISKTYSIRLNYIINKLIRSTNIKFQPLEHTKTNQFPNFASHATCQRHPYLS